MIMKLHNKTTIRVISKVYFYVHWQKTLLVERIFSIEKIYFYYILS